MKRPVARADQQQRLDPRNQPQLGPERLLARLVAQQLLGRHGPGRAAENGQPQQRLLGNAAHMLDRAALVAGNAAKATMLIIAR